MKNEPKIIYLNCDDDATPDNDFSIYDTEFVTWSEDHKCSEIAVKFYNESEVKRMQEQIKPEWVSVKDMLPEDHKLVLVHLESGATTVGRMSKLFTHWLAFKMKGCTISVVTHWMPLPEPPKL